MSHTPGPWQWKFNELVDADGDEVLSLEDDGACGDPECCGAPSYRIEGSLEDQRLIAAAPDLLNVCKRLLALYDDPEGGLAKDARAAIAKAEGR